MSALSTAEAKPGIRTAAKSRALLGALAVSGPLWAAVSLIQAFTRPGFDLSRHPLSMLSLGDLGWLQIANFIVAGVLAIIGARGLRQATESAWAPRLVTIYGAGYILAGVFTLEPAAGFPVGTPTAPPTGMAWHSGLHLLSGMIAFIALAAALIVLGRVFSRRHERGWAWGAIIAAVVVILATFASSAQLLAPSIILAVGVIAGMVTLSVIALKLRRNG